MKDVFIPNMKFLAYAISELHDLTFFPLLPSGSNTLLIIQLILIGLRKLSAKFHWDPSRVVKLYKAKTDDIECQ